jgi:hypothetical protein
MMLVPRLRIALIALVVVFLGGDAFAIQYDVPILVQTEEDIRDLVVNDDITEEAGERLLALLLRPVRVNEADREALYELPAVTYRLADAILATRESLGGFGGLRDLEKVPGMSPDILNQLRPFVRIQRPVIPPVLLHGKARVGLMDSLSDDEVPGFYLRSQVEVGDWLEVGALVLLASDPGSLSYVSYQETADFKGETFEELAPFFIAEKSAFRFVPTNQKLYVSTDQLLFGPTRLRAIAGSYVLGFGQRLTFDRSHRVQPDGWYPDVLVQPNYEKGRVAPGRGMFGAAISLDRLELAPEVWVHATGFVSWWRHRLYQYEMRLRDPGEDLADPLDDEFGSPKAYFSYADSFPSDDYDYDGDGTIDANDEWYDEDPSYKCGPDDQDRCHQYETFHSAYSELIAGGNTSFHFGERSHVGLTGYWAGVDFVVGDERLEFSDAATFPNDRKSFFAVGMDGALGAGPVDVLAEFTTMDTGGLAFYSKAIAEVGAIDMELEGRYYSTDFDNPYSRGRAQPDEYFGRRARDEAGGRFQMLGKPNRDWKMRGYVDMWQQIRAEQLNLEGFFRTDYRIQRELMVATWLKVNDKDLEQGGRDEDYGVSVYDTEELSFLQTALEQLESGAITEEYYDSLVSEADPFDDAAGMKVDWGTRIQSKHIPRTALTLYGKLSWRDANSGNDLYGESTDWFDSHFERSYVAALEARVKALDWLRLNTRLRVEQLDFDRRSSGSEGEIEWYFQAVARPTKWFWVNVRYDYKTHFLVDHKESFPDDAHLLRATADFKF